jgi:hypothetical protein
VKVVDLSMKKSFRKLLIITLLISSFVIGLSFAAKTIQADDDDDDDYGFYLDLYYATYGDYDSDGEEDDCYFKGKLCLQSKTEFKSYWFLILELPSGLTFKFDHSCLVESDDGRIDFRIYTFNTAIESGWYKGVLYCNLIKGSGLGYSLRDTIVFDPPNPISPGDPWGSFQID